MVSRSSPHLTDHLHIAELAGDKCLGESLQEIGEMLLIGEPTHVWLAPAGPRLLSRPVTNLHSFRLQIFKIVSENQESKCKFLLKPMESFVSQLRVSLVKASPFNVYIVLV